MSANLFPTMYTPGYRWPKRVLTCAGLLLIGVGAFHLITPLRLVTLGVRADAQVSDIAKTKPGLTDVILTKDSEIQAALAEHDRACLYWDDFQYNTASGKLITTRAPVASQFIPLYPLKDADGLPTIATVFYDASHPDNAVFPGLISVWLPSVALIFVGFITTLIGSFLLYWSNKAIDLPPLPLPSRNASLSNP